MFIWIEKLKSYLAGFDNEGFCKLIMWRTFPINRKLQRQLRGLSNNVFKAHTLLGYIIRLEISLATQAYRKFSR